MRRPRNSSAIVVPFLFAAALAPACNRSRAAPARAAQAAAADAPDLNPTRVATVAVEAQDLILSATMPGSVRALESVELYAKVGGYVERIEVDIGDEVQEGQVLAVIDVPEMLPELRRQEAEVELARSRVEQQAAAIAQASAAAAGVRADLERLAAVRREKEADLAFRQAALERWQGLLEESPSVEPRKLDEARFERDAAVAAVALVDADAASARARVEEAEAVVAKARADERVARALVPVAEASQQAARERASCAEIKSPFAGVVTERHVDRGAFIRPGATNSAAMPLLRLERVDRVRIGVDLAMDSIAALNRGDRVRFENVASAPGASFEGVIARTAGALNERSRMMRAEVELDNPRGADGARRLHPGDYGDLTVFLDELPGTPTVPASAVFTHAGETCVFAVEDGALQRRPIAVVFRDGTRVGVAQGLSVGERVVSAGVHDLEHGQRVRVDPVQPTAPGGH